ncbi:cytochrome P460 family protein [bacterium]|nr:cytochrome P460 family protein [bacterium]
MKARFAIGLATLGLSALLFAGCSDSGTTPQEHSEFEGYDAWNMVEYTNAPSAFLGPAHQGSNPEYTRRIFTNADPLRVDEYPEGSIFVKETFTHDGMGEFSWPDAMGLLAMVKRGSDYDAEDGNWEYAIVDENNLDVLDSGADLGSCKGCHTNATGSHGQDYIFAHPYQYEAQVADFDDFANWHLIDTAQGMDPFLGDAHAGNDENAVRRIYKKQLAANPGQAGWGYPVGTTILKTVHDDSENLIGQTAMVKRGGGYDEANGDWEYFMWDVGNGSIVAQGALAGCIDCHGAANGGGGGMDYVFPHSGDPFNN